MDKSLNIAEYLASGQLELYVAGSLPPKEMEEVTSLAQEYPEIQAEIEAIEKAFQHYAGVYSGNGPSESALRGALTEIASEKDEAIVTPFNTTVEEKKAGFPVWRYAAAAVLIVSLGVNLWLFLRWQDTRQELDNVIAERQVLAQERNQLQARYEVQDDMLAHLNSPQIQSVQLDGLPISPESQVKVAWNDQTGRVLLKVNDLPPAPTGKQYQLWAIIGGVPVSAGLLKVGEEIQWMDQVTGEAVAFAITLEPEGGSVDPTLDQMYVVGNVDVG